MENDKLSILEGIQMEECHVLLLHSCPEKISLKTRLLGIHIFWGCPSVTPFWTKIHGILETVFQAKITFNSELMYLIRLEELEWRKNHFFPGLWLASSSSSWCSFRVTVISPPVGLACSCQLFNCVLHLIIWTEMFYDSACLCRTLFL